MIIKTLHKGKRIEPKPDEDEFITGILHWDNSGNYHIIRVNHVCVDDLTPYSVYADSVEVVITERFKYK